MLAGLLLKHGVWVGEAKVTQAPETNPQVGTENVHIKQYLKGIRGGTCPGDFHEKILSMVDADGPWLIKTPLLLETWRCFAWGFPDALWLFPVRPMADLVRSAMRHPGMAHNPDDRRKKAQRHFDLQTEAAPHVRHKFVSVDRIANLDAAHAREVLDFCGMTLDRATWADWIDPTLWKRT